MDDLEIIENIKTTIIQNNKYLQDIQLKSNSVQYKNNDVVLKISDIIHQHISKVEGRLDLLIDRFKQIEQKYTDQTIKIMSLEKSIKNQADQNKQLATENNELRSYIQDLMNNIENHDSDQKKFKEAIPLIIKHHIFENEKSLFFELFNSFKKKNEDVISKAKVVMKSDNTNYYISELAVKLPDLLSNFSTLQHSLSEKVMAIRDYFAQLQRILLIDSTESFIKKKSTEISNGNQNSEVIRMQMFSRISRSVFLLRSFMHLPDINELFNFKPEMWIRNHFLNFVNEFMVEYGKEQSEKNKSQLEASFKIIQKVLSIAKISIIEIDLGKTLFDSDIHFLKETSERPDYPDNTIIDIYRHGFQSVNGRVIQKPEVIVNKQVSGNPKTI